MPIKWRIYIILVVLGGLAIMSRQRYYAGKWRKYESVETGVALKYPAVWFSVGPSKLPSQKYIDLCTMNFPVIDSIELRVYSDSEDNLKQQKVASFGEWLIHKNSKYVHILGRRDVNIGEGDYPGEEVLFEDKSFRGRIITLQHHGQVYAIEIHAVKKKWNEANTVFDKILGTFEFSD